MKSFSIKCFSSLFACCRAWPAMSADIEVPMTMCQHCHDCHNVAHITMLLTPLIVTLLTFFMLLAVACLWFPASLSWMQQDCAFIWFSIFARYFLHLASLRTSDRLHCTFVIMWSTVIGGNNWKWLWLYPQWPHPWWDPLLFTGVAQKDFWCSPCIFLPF